MIWHIEILAGGRSSLEPLCAVPCHVLDCDEGPVGEEQEIEEAVADDCVVCTLDDRRQGTEC